MTEADIQRLIQVAVTREGGRLFRNNTGTGWTGDVRHVRKTEAILCHPGDVVIRSARPLHAGLCVGSSDLIGWTPCEIEGERLAIFTAVEVKTSRGRITSEQQNFVDNVAQAGGVGLIARSIDDVTLALGRRGRVK